MSPVKSGSTESTLSALSSQLTAAVETASHSVVAIHARRRIPSSGIVWRDGVIVAANHTVRRDDDISVTLPTGDTRPATIVGRDPETDLIALRLKDLPASHIAAKASGEAARVGCLVLAVGRPGREATASFGIISAIREGWRAAQGARVDRVFRLDLAVYDGFSGGPLVDPSGAVLGLNNSALARGAPIALPASVLDRVLDELLERGHVRRPFLGVAVQPIAISASLVTKHRLVQDTALLVMSVAEGAPSEKAGFMVGDALLAANGQPLRHPVDLVDALSGPPSGAPVNFTLLRGGAVLSASVVPGDRGARE